MKGSSGGEAVAVEEDGTDNDTMPSGTKRGGFVVYRETVELMNALDLEK